MSAIIYKGARYVLAFDEKELKPDEYHKEHGKCPTGHHWNGKKCIEIENKNLTPEQQASGGKKKKKTEKSEAKKEYEGEFDNPYIRGWFPDAFKTKKEFVKAYKKAPIEHLDNLDDVDNSQSKAVKKGDFKSLAKTLWENKKDMFMKGGHKHQEGASPKHLFMKWLKKKIKRAKKGKHFPTIIGVHEDPDTGKKHEWLIGGNSRSLIHKYLGLKAPVKKIPLKGKRRTEDEHREHMTKEHGWKYTQVPGGWNIQTPD